MSTRCVVIDHAPAVRTPMSGCAHATYTFDTAIHTPLPNDDGDGWTSDIGTKLHYYDAHDALDNPACVYVSLHGQYYHATVECAQRQVGARLGRFPVQRVPAGSLFVVSRQPCAKCCLRRARQSHGRPCERKEITPCPKRGTDVGPYPDLLRLSPPPPPPPPPPSNNDVAVTARPAGSLARCRYRRRALPARARAFNACPMVTDPDGDEEWLPTGAVQIRIRQIAGRGQKRPRHDNRAPAARNPKKPRHGHTRTAGVLQGCDTGAVEPFTLNGKWVAFVRQEAGTVQEWSVGLTKWPGHGGDDSGSEMHGRLMERATVAMLAMRRYRRGAKFRWRATIRGARERGIPFALERGIAQNLMKRSCVYCGIDAGARAHGLDRVNNELGYLLHNTVQSCWTCNRMKGSCAVHDFVVACVRIARPRRTAASNALFDGVTARVSASMTFARYRQRAERLGLVFDIAPDQFARIAMSACAYCGRAPSAASPMGMDRMDNDGGYLPSNVCACCSLCNNMKGTLGVEAFRDQCVRIDARWGATVLDFVATCPARASHAEYGRRTAILERAIVTAAHRGLFVSLIDDNSDYGGETRPEALPFWTRLPVSPVVLT